MVKEACRRCHSIGENDTSKVFDRALSGLANTPKRPILLLGILPNDILLQFWSLHTSMAYTRSHAWYTPGPMTENRTRPFVMSVSITR